MVKPGFLRSWRIAQRTSCPQTLPTRSAAAFPHLLPDLFEAAELCQCGATGLVGGDACSNLFVSHHVRRRSGAHHQAELSTCCFWKQIVKGAADAGPELHLSPLGCFQGIGHCESDPCPLFGLDIELLFTGSGEPVKPRSAIVLRSRPRRSSTSRPPPCDEGQGKEGTGLDEKGFRG